MKALSYLLALLLAWLALAGGYHLVGYPHFLGGAMPNWWTTCFGPAVPEALHFGVALALLGPLSLMLSAWLALWGRWQRRAASGKAGAPGPADHRDIWLAG